MVYLTSVLCFTTVSLTVFVFRRLMSVAFIKSETNIPGPGIGRRWPIIGDALWFWNVKTGRELMKSVRWICSTQEKILSCYICSKLVIMVMDANILEKIIARNKCAEKEDWIYYAFNSFSNGVFSKNGKGWANLRRPLDRLLHPKHMGDYYKVMTVKAKTLCIKVEDKCNKGVFDIRHMSEFCTLDIIFEALLGVQGTQQIEDTYSVLDGIDKITESIFSRLLNIQLRNDWIYYYISSLGKEERKQRNRLSPLMKKLVDDCRHILESEGRDPAKPELVPKNFIEVAIQAGIEENKSEDELKFSFGDFIVAGFDTTGVLVSSTLLFLAMYPKYQEIAYQEQIEVMKDNPEAPSMDELSRMRFLDMVFNESMRHVSPRSIGRNVRDEFTVDGYIFPKGACILVMFEELFHDARYWEKPKEFYPEHFLPESVAVRPKGAFLPFAFGSRVCPGKLFGTLSFKLILSMLLRRFKFTTDLKFEELEYKYKVMLESEKGYLVKVTARDDIFS